MLVAPKPAPSVEVSQFAHPRANRETRLGGQRVGYEFKRGQRRTIGFSVSAEGLVVRAPKWVTLAQVEAALQEKSTWIVRKLDETRARHAQAQSQRMEWRHGAKLPLLGASVALVLDPERRLRAGSELQPVPSAESDAVPLATAGHSLAPVRHGRAGAGSSAALAHAPRPRPVCGAFESLCAPVAGAVAQAGLEQRCHPLGQCQERWLHSPELAAHSL